MSDCSIDSPAPGHLTVRGDLDFENAPPALARGLALLGDAKECEIDLSGLSSGDSAGLAVLIEWLASALRRGATLRYTGVPAQMRAIARISELEDLLSERRRSVIHPLDDSASGSGSGSADGSGSAGASPSAGGSEAPSPASSSRSSNSSSGSSGGSPS
jgi:phospholipid transport system transporter-binding protein